MNTVVAPLKRAIELFAVLHCQIENMLGNMHRSANHIVLKSRSMHMTSVAVLHEEAGGEQMRFLQINGHT